MGTVRQAGLLYALHRNCVFEDPDFIAEANLLKNNSDVKPQFNELANKFALKPKDLEAYFSNSEITKIAPETGIKIGPQGLSIEIRPYTTLADVTENWPLIEAMKSLAYDDYKPTKRKLPENPQLIYAVFKARRSGKTFRQIFEDYRNGQLPNYSGSKSQFNDQESLERYYGKYRPDS